MREIEPIQCPPVEKLAPWVEPRNPWEAEYMELFLSGDQGLIYLHEKNKEKKQ